MMPRAIAEYTAVEKVSVAHELINVLDYGGEFCDDSNDYLLDQCKQDQIQQVKINLSTAKIFRNQRICLGRSPRLKSFLILDFHLSKSSLQL